MKKWLLRLLWIPAFIIAVAFLVANRQMVSISLDPINASEPALTTFAMPLWSWLMIMLFVGFGAGAFGGWLSARPLRVKTRADQKLVKELRQEISGLEAQIRDQDQSPASPGATAPPALLTSEDA